MIIGGLVVIVLFTALIAPWFINWDDYKATFEAEAEKILGQPVRVHGSADASILPSPSLTFTDVKVGDTEGRPMMTVDRFAVTIELLPLLQGEIRVVSMTLERPVVRVSVDDTGQVDWLLRSDASRSLNPDSVVLSGVSITDGTLVYSDASAGSTVEFEDIRATVEARSLSGPWRIEGSYAADGTPVQFSVGTGIRSDDGSLRVKVDAVPGHWPIAVAADGLVSGGANGPSFVGTYNLTQVVVSDGQRSGDAPGWRSEGSFTLTRDRLLVDKAVLSEGPPDRPSSMAGSAIIELGEDARFEATLQARQLDLDRSLGAGPSEPVEVGAAAARFVDWLAGIPVPPIAGLIRFDVPAIVVGGNIIRDVRFRARPEDYGWRIEGLQATLPGQAAFQADGQLSTGEQVGFGGQVRLAVGQPATFAAWWRGQDQNGAGRLLAPFELTGRATVTPDSVAVKDMSTRIDNATIAGAFSWSRTREAGGERRLRTDLQADRLDFIQIQALAELLRGQDFSDAAVIADSYAIKLAAGELATEDVRMRDVAIDAAFDDGDLTVNGIRIGDIGGASFEVTRGQIDDVLSQPRGRLEAQLTAGDLGGLARIVDRMAPDTPLSRWFNRTAPALSAATATLKIDSVLDNGVPNSQLEVRGSAGASQFDITVELAGAPADWRTARARLVGSLKSYDAVGVARQAGIDAANIDIGGASIVFEAAGIPQDGMETRLDFGFGDLSLDSEGILILAADLPPKYTGTYDLKTGDVDPLIGMVGLAIPGSALGTPLALSGDVDVLGPTAELAWTNGLVAGQRMTGDLRIAEADDGGIRIEGGTIELDTVDLGWIASLGLGFAPQPGDDPEQPWPRTPFDEPVYGRLSAELDIAAERLTVSDSLSITNAKLQMTMVPNRIALSVKSGDAIGGQVTGGLSIRNVGGNANVNGQLSLLGASLDPVIWHRAGRAVATGTLDLSVDFESTGRSPAGLISSLTGGGTLALSAGEARYVNPQAANLVIRASDRGQQFDEDQLRDLFASYIDAGALEFTQAEAAFSIAAGTVRLQNLAVRTEAASASGSAAIDLNKMQIDSDWTLTLQSGDVDDPGPPPQVGIVFRGPIAAPDRILDVLQFNSYLNIRQEARIQQILIMEEEARLERERLNRLKRKLKEDGLRREELEEAARVARRTAALNLEEFQVSRGIHIEAAAEAGRVAWWDRMTVAREDKLAALEAARQAMAAAEAAAERTAAAVEAVAAAERATREVADQGEAAAGALAEANQGLAEARQQAVAAEETVAAAEARLEAAAEAVSGGEGALEDATAEHDAARAAVTAAAEVLQSATETVGSAQTLAQSARAVAAAAEAEAKDKAALAAAADDTLRAAEAAAATASANVTALTEVQTVADKTYAEAKAAVAAGAERLVGLEAEAKTAEAELAAAEAVAAEAEAVVAAAVQGADSAASEADLVEQLVIAARQRWDDVSQTVEQARAEVARLEALADEDAADSEPGAVDGEADPIVGESEALTRARQALAAAETVQKEADIRLGEAESADADAKAQVEQATLEVEAARKALDQARADADAKVEPAALTRQAAEKAKANDAIATALAEAAGTAAGTAAANVASALAAAEEAETTLQAAGEAAAAARDQAEAAEDLAEKAAAEAEAAEQAVATAKAAAEQAAQARAEAEESAVATARAGGEATDRLEEADSERLAAEAALEQAREALAEANQRLEAAGGDVAEKERVQNEILARAQVLLDELRAARQAAAIASKEAAEARDAARQAADRAEALPEGWPPVAAETDRAALPSTEDTVTVTDAALDVVVEPALVPISDNPPVIPRPRPNRPQLRVAEPTPVIDTGPILPTDSDPLVINTPN